MQRSLSLSLSYIEHLDQTSLRAFHKQFLEMHYNEAEGFGFQEVSIDDDYLAAKLVKRVTTIIPYFDFQAGRMIEREIYLYSEIEFAIDQTYQLLEVFGAARHAGKVRAALRPLLGPNISLISADLAPGEVIPRLVKKTSETQIERLTVNNFQHSEGIVGRYEMKLANSDLAMKIISRYKHDVVKARICLSIPTVSSFVINISQSGRLSLTCDETHLKDALSFLKSTLFGDKE